MEPIISGEEVDEDDVEEDAVAVEADNDDYVEWQSSWHDVPLVSLTEEHRFPSFKTKQQFCSVEPFWSHKCST